MSKVGSPLRWASLAGLLSAATTALAIAPALPQRAGPVVAPARVLGVALDQPCGNVRSGLVNAGFKESAVAGDQLSALLVARTPLAAPFSKATTARLTCAAPGGQASELAITVAGSGSAQAPLREVTRLPAGSGWRAMVFNHGADQTIVVYQRLGLSPVPKGAS